MKKSVCSVLTKVGFAALVLSLNLFAACEIGLGSSVDVDAPKIDFSENTLESGAVVRDAFAVFGSWEDDGSIGSINATLKNLETGAEVKKAGTIGDKQWSVAFSPADDSITDGTYELSIAIKDGADHESKISRSFIIDNTPPLVVLSRPSTKIGAASFDSYGQKFTLEGKAADDNDVSLIEVNVYADADCSGSPLKTISLPSVPLTIETDVAEYSKTAANDYSVIYGKVDENGIAKRDGGTVERYCKLVVYDGAQRYPADGSAQTEADKKGNSVDYYYLNSDLAELFTEGYKITELYHILNGTYAESNARTTSPDGVVTLLKSDTTKVTTGQFKLNPENSPHFVVSARSILEAGHTIDEAPLTNGNSKLEVEIAPGLDGHLIKEETIGIYLVRCDNYGNPLKEDGSAAADESEAKIIWLVETDKHEQQAEITQSGSTYKFKTKTEVGSANYPDLMIGENYYVAVVGKDMQGNNILCDGIYGFQLITSGLNIEVGIRSEPDWISTNANANDVNKTPKIILTYSTENKPFEILRGLDAANLVSIDTGVMTSPYQDNLNITSTGPLGFEPTIVVYKVNGENSAESNPKSIELRYDDTAPQVTISVKPDEIATEQKSITFRGTAADKNSNGEEESGVKTVYIQILDKATPTNATPVAGSLNAIKASVSGGEWLCQIKPEDYTAVGSAFTAEGPKIIKVTAVDGVGLTTLVSDEFMFDTAKPKITLKKYNLYGEFNDASKAKNVDSTIVVGKTFRINGTLVEKYGLDASAGFKIKQEWKNFAETSTSEKTIDMPAVDASGNWAITLPFNGTDGSAYDNDTIVNNHSADGIYTYTITAKDKAGKTDNDGITFTAKLKTDGPLLEISSPEFDSSNVTKYWQKNRDIMFSGKASSPATVSAIYWTQDESKTTDSWAGWEKAEGTDYWNFTVSVAADGDNHKVFIAAVDSLGNKTSKLEYTIKVDSTGPEVAPKFYQIGSDVIQAVNGSSIYVSGINPQKLTVYGKYNETVSGPYVPKTGDTLKPLAFQIDGADKTPIIKYSNTDISSLTADELSSDAVKNSFSATSPSLATNSWKAEFTTSDIAAGSFAVTARNGANVPKENTDLSIVIDSKKPEFGNSISITKSSYDRTEDQGDQNTENDVLYYYVNNRDKTTISGTASDANLLSVKIKAESTGKTTINKSETSNPYNWSFELDMTGWTSDTDVTLTVTDKAGNTATKLLKLVFDTTPPLAKHEWDKNDKDLYFRVGESDNVLKELKSWKSSISALDTSLDKNVGGKYLNGTYGNSETIRIRGDFEEAGSGLSAIYYKAFDTEPTEAVVKAFIASPETEKTGNAITPKIVKQRVSWTNEDGSKIFKENVQTSYTTLISDLKANAANYLVIVAVDKVGNVGLDYAEKTNYEETRDTDITKPEYYKAKKFEDAYYTINIDTVLPENQLDANTVTTGYINPALSGDITISGVANSGKQAGVLPEKSSKVYVELLVNEKSIVSAKHDDYNENKDYGLVTLDTTTSPYADNNAHWTATIKTSKVFENKTTGTYPVSVIVTDAAGNKQTFSGVNINVDTTAPKVNINTIADADKDSTDKLDVNGKLTIDGTASDTEKLSSVKIEYKKTADSDTDTEGNSNWTELTQLSGSTPNNWKAELDTTTLDDKNNYDIRVTASDAAGNTKAETKTVYVNQDSDRPVVRFSNLTKDDDGNFILKYGKNASLEGTITDDDATSTAVVKVFKASSKPITSENDSTISGTTSFNKATGDYTFTPAEHADGSKTVYFYMEDNNGKKFYTTHTEDLNQPYQLYKTDTKTTTAQDGTVTSNNHAGEISYKSDSEAPEISSPKLQAFSKANLTIPATINDWANSTDYEVDDVVHVEINGQTKTYACSKAYTSAATGEFNPDNWKDITPVYLGESCVVGGPTAAAYLETGKNYVELTASAKDANGINKIEITANGVTYDSTVDADGTLTTENEKDDSGNETGLVIYSFTTKRIDISGIAAGNVDVVVKVTDNSGLYSNNKTSFLVDRTAPDISISTPQNNGTLYYGTIEQNVAGSIIGGGDVNKVYFKVSLDPFNENLSDFTDGVDITNSLSSMASIVFDGKDTADANGFHTKTLQKWIEELKGDSYDKDDDTNVPVSVYYKAVDNCGNFSVKGCWLDVIPNGDKPVVNISYPTNKEDSSGNITIIPALSGTIRLNGTAKCPAYSVDSVYIQIAKDYTASYNWDNWYTDSAITNGEYTIVDIPGSTMKGIKASGTVDNWNLPINSKKEFEPAAGSTRNMAIRVYALHKRTPAGGSEIKKLSDPVVQQFTIDPNAPHIGGEDKVVDGRLRHSLQLVQFEKNHDGEFDHIANRKAYKSEMWITGKWYLIASVYDNQGIDSIILSQPGSNDTTDLITNGWAKEADSGSAAKNYDLCIPLPTDSGVGNVVYTIEAKEKSDDNFNSKETIRINYDNTAPKLGTKDHDKYNIAPGVQQSNGFYQLNGYASDAEGDSSVSGMKAIAFYFMRRGSANTRVYDPMWKNKFVAVRTGSIDSSDITYSHGLYWKHKTLGTRNATNLKELSLTASDDNIHTGGLALLGGTIYRIESVSGTTVTVDEDVPLTITEADFGLALVVDNLTKKETTNGRDKITTEGAYGYGYHKASSTADDGDLMQEDWDGTTTEGQWVARINSANIPDGPIEIHYVAFDKSQNYAVGIVGNVAKTAYLALPTKDALANKDITGTEDTTTKLATNFYYAFSTPAYVSNNAPRIAGVTVGTDYNGDGDITDGSSDANGKPTLKETRTSFVDQKDVRFSDVKTAVAGGLTNLFIASKNNTETGDAMMALKGKTSIWVEIVGGNESMFYQYSIDGSSYKTHDEIADITAGQAGAFNKNETALSFDREDEGLAKDADDGLEYYKSTTLPAITFEESDIKDWTNAPTNKTWLTFEFWDSTEETTPFTNSQFAQLKLPVGIQVRDTTRPNTVINKLYWRSSTNNSIYRDSNDALLGHLELKGDLGTAAIASTANYGSTDDKVSGTVIFRGYAYDNKRLSKLEWSIVSSDGKTSLLPYTAANKLTYTTGATFSGGTWTGSGTLGATTQVDATKHYKFTVNELFDENDSWNSNGSEAYLNENGHKVYWELIVDTSAINGTVAKDAKLYVRAMDASGETNTQYTNMAATGTSESDVTQNASPTYQVDIVPYITGVQTFLSGENATSLQSRTARGYYPVFSTETVTFTGYNLSGAKYVKKLKAQGETDDTLINMTNGKLAVSNITSSGEILLRVGSLYSINNMNNNDATGTSGKTVTDEAIRAGDVTYNTVANYAYNRKPNSSINNTLTDDVVFDVWEINSKAAMPESAGMINEPVMRINPTNGRIGFAFVNGPAYFSMPSGNNNVNGTNNSYTRWQRNYDDFAGVSFVYDAQGNVHGTTIGRDVESNDMLAGKFTYVTSKWGAGNLNDSSDNYNDTNSKIRLETIGLPAGVVVNGTALAKPVLDKSRIRSPSIAVANNSTYTYTQQDQSTNWQVVQKTGSRQTVYLAYYDNLQRQIRFRWARGGAIKSDTENSLNDSNELNDTAMGQFVEHDGNCRNGQHWKGVTEVPAAEYSVVAGVDYETKNFTYWYDDDHPASSTPGDNGTYYGYNTGAKAGEYLSLGVIENEANTATDDVVVLVWYDGSDCWYSYKVNPCNDHDGGNTGVNAGKAGTDGYWSTPVKVFSSAGEYCKIAVGKDGSIHIAAATVKSQLMYAYMSSYSDTANIKTSLVDAEGLTGTHIGLDTIVSENGNVVPYISCYMQSSGKSKIAYLLDSATSVDYDAEGCNSSGVFTGLWEVSIVPTESRLSADNINVAFYKETSGADEGKAKAIPSGTNKADGSNITDSTSTALYGVTYGNNTKNPVVAYVVQSGTNGNIETAQKR